MDIALYLEKFNELLKELPDILIYLLLFLSAYVENIFPPIPGDTVTVFGAYLVGIGHVAFVGVFISTTLGSIAGFMTYYFIGLKLGISFFEKRKMKIISTKQIEKVNKWFGKFGYGIIIFNRFLSGIRSVISIFAGLSKLVWWKVFIFGLISCSVWNGMLIYIGYLLGDNWKDIEKYLSKYNKIVFTILGIFVLIFIIYKLYKYIKNKKNKKNTNENIENE